MKAPEEIFLRNKIRENYSVPENFYLQHFDYLNAENVLHWLTDFSSSKDARIKDLEESLNDCKLFIEALSNTSKPNNNLLAFLDKINTALTNKTE
jgi:hypothetical protein